MKRRICLIIAGIILVAILAFAFYKLSAGDSFEKTLVSSEWYVQMSEGTTAVYTFHKNGTFDCEAHIALGEQEASMTRSGTYAVDKDESGAPRVLLQYPNANAPWKSPARKKKTERSAWRSRAAKCRKMDSKIPGDFQNLRVLFCPFPGVSLLSFRCME